MRGSEYGCAEPLQQAAEAPDYSDPHTTLVVIASSCMFHGCEVKQITPGVPVSLPSCSSSPCEPCPTATNVCGDSDKDSETAAAAQAKKEIYWVGLPRGGTDSRAERSRQEILRRRAKLEQQHGFMQVSYPMF
jgi:hypothetical protein